MASSNPAFNNPAFQDQSAVRSYPGASSSTGVGLTPPAAAPSDARLESAFAAPSASALDTGRMTVEDTVFKTLGLFVILVVTAIVGWVWTMAPVTAANPSPSMAPWLLGAIGGFIFAMIVSFTSHTKVRPGLIFAYAAFEGLFIGSISAYFEFLFPGIVMQATLATLSVVGVTLALFASGKIRASARATKIFMIAMVGYLVFSLLNVVLMLFNVPMAGGMFGMYSSVKILGIPLGVIIGVVVIIMAAYSLVLDFDQVQQGVRNGAPRQFGWLGAFGIMVTVVWLYVEVLRLIAILRSNN